MSINAVSAAVNSIQTASSQAAQSAQKVADFAANGDDLAQAFVGANLASNQIQADAAVIKTQNQTQDALLNIIA